MNSYTNPVKTKRQGYQAGTYYGVDRNLDSNSCKCDSKSSKGGNVELLFTPEEFRALIEMSPKDSAAAVYEKLNGDALNGIGKVLQDEQFYQLITAGENRVHPNNKIFLIVDLQDPGYNSMIHGMYPRIVTVNGVKPNGTLGINSLNGDVEIALDGVSLVPYGEIEEDNGLPKGNSNTKGANGTKESDSGGHTYTVELEYSNGTNFAYSYCTCGVREDGKTLFGKIGSNIVAGGGETKAANDPNAYFPQPTDLRKITFSPETYTELVAFFNGNEPNSDEIETEQNSEAVWHFYGQKTPLERLPEIIENMENFEVPQEDTLEPGVNAHTE